MSLTTRSQVALNALLWLLHGLLRKRTYGIFSQNTQSTVENTLSYLHVTIVHKYEGAPVSTFMSYIVTKLCLCWAVHSIVIERNEHYYSSYLKGFLKKRRLDSSCSSSAIESSATLHILVVWRALNLSQVHGSYS